MKVRTISVCISTALLISVSTSTVFADVSPVSERSSLIPSDTILWNVQGTPSNSDTEPDPNYYLRNLVSSTSTSNVLAENGTDVAVSHMVVVNPGSETTFDIISEPSVWFRNSNFTDDDDFLLSTYAYGDGNGSGPFGGYNDDRPNPSTFVFSGTNAGNICGFGTQIAPYDLGQFTATIQASDDGGPIGLPFPITGFDDDASAAFIGIKSTTPLTSVEIVVTSTGGDVKSWYAINQVTLTYCSDLPVEPEVPALTCDGFAAPMANYPVTAKKNRVFPLKMELFDEDGIEQTDVELVAAPVVNVEHDSSSPPVAQDLSDLLSTGQGSDGNMFDFTDDGIWQFNLKSKNLSSGTYTVTVVSGDDEEYVIDSTCETQFIIK